MQLNMLFAQRGLRDFTKQCCPGLPCQFLGIPHVPVCGYMLPNLSPSPNLYKIQSVYNNNVAL